MPTGGVRFPFAGLTTADIPLVVRTFALAPRTVRVLFDQPMSPIVDSPVAAAQFIFRAPNPDVPGTSIVQIASRLFEIQWSFGAETAISIGYVPNGEHLTSTPGGDLGTFEIAIPFP